MLRAAGTIPWSKGTEEQGTIPWSKGTEEQVEEWTMNVYTWSDCFAAVLQRSKIWREWLGEISSN